MSSWIVDLPDRLDAFLAAQGRMLSRAKAQKAIEESRVRVNDQPVTRSSLRLQEGDVVSLEELDAPHASAITPVDLRLPILYEDDACMVIDKPAGIAVHPGAGMLPGEPTLLHGIAFLFTERSLPFSPDAVLVHRLDKPTTGCLLLAKTADAHIALQKQFEGRTVSKTYLALVAGVPSPSSAVIDAPVGRSGSDRTKMSVFSASGARESKTTYRTVQTSRNAALLACDLHTGRTHQIRVHLSTIGHPVLGDDTYVNQLSERLTQEFDIRSLCLHAWKLAFRSPADAVEHRVAAPLPRAFAEVLQRVAIAWTQS